tara:strand:- start:395 stop:2605 length:2211 start_codon:yes stop_codon:yes gene_type:complete
MPDKNILSDEPSVYTVDKFITDKECEHFINIARDKLQIALVSTSEKGLQSQGRTGKNCWVKHDYDKTTLAVGKRIAGMIGIPLEKAESYQIIYYDQEQEYRNHYDGWLHDKSAKSIRCMKNGGQRLRTALCYLNTVEEGGHTRMTRLNINVSAEKGKLLVFTNVKENTNVRHELTEHAGTPVIKGEKWAFNLWFREEPRDVIVYNPDVSEVAEVNNNTSTLVTAKSEPQSVPTHLSTTTESKTPLVDIIPVSNNIEVMSNTNIGKQKFTIKYKEIPGDPVLQIFEGALSPDITKQFLSVLKFPPNERKTGWLKNQDFAVIVDYIAQLTRTDASTFENISVVQYPPKHVHNRHFDAFNDDRLSKESRGQRLRTITGFLTPGFVYSFAASKIKAMESIVCDCGTLITYNNVFPDTNVRDNRLSKSIINNTDQHAYLFHIYVRSVNRPDMPPSSSSSQVQSTIQNVQPDPKIQSIQKTEAESVNINENYTQTLNETYELFKTGEISKRGHKSLTYSNIRTDWSHVVDTINKLNDIRSSSPNGIIPKERLEATYNFDEFTPVIIEDTIIPEALQVISNYYKFGIESGQFPLGDRQSQRYKARDDPVARILNYELLPLVERFTGSKLRPTYSYLSCYKKGADLPCHGDNTSCEITVSFMLDKPVATNWNIYFHLKRQKKHCGGRSDFTPSKDECVACDCHPGGLMSFMGQDHLHFREPLEHEYYNLLLLHYVDINNTEATC